MNRVLQWKLVAGFVLVFLAGAVTGTFIGAHQMRHPYFHGPPGGFLKERMGERLRDELELTPQQVAKIAPVLDRATAQLESIRAETANRVHETMKKAHEEMAGALTAEQQEKLKKLEFRHHRRFRHFHERSRPPEGDTDE